MEEKNLKLSVALLIYSFLYCFFHITPALLPGFMRLPISWGDALDFLTPFVIIPAVYWIYSQIKVSHESEANNHGLLARRAAKIILAAGCLLYVNGHGIHLSANSIARLLESQKGSKLFKAVYLYDEVISHFMWDGGVFLISIGFIVGAMKILWSPLSKTSFITALVGAIFYGFTFAVNGIEGQTVLFTFPAASVCFAFALIVWLKSRGEAKQNPVLVFFLMAYLLSVLLFAYWGISRHGFPEFSKLGWI